MKLKTENDFYHELLEKSLKEMEERHKEAVFDLSTPEKERSVKESLASYISEEAKYRPSYDILLNQDIEELIKESNSVETMAVYEIAESQSQNEYYKYMESMAEQFPDKFLVVKNPEYEEYPYAYPGHYPKIIKLNQDPSIENTLASAFLNAKSLNKTQAEDKNKKTKKKGLKL